jgi:hypothetical protein
MPHASETKCQLVHDPHPAYQNYKRKLCHLSYVLFFLGPAFIVRKAVGLCRCQHVSSTALLRHSCGYQSSTRPIPPPHPHVGQFSICRSAGRLSCGKPSARPAGGGRPTNGTLQHSCGCSRHPARKPAAAPGPYMPVADSSTKALLATTRDLGKQHRRTPCDNAVGGAAAARDVCPGWAPYLSHHRAPAQSKGNSVLRVNCTTPLSESACGPFHFYAEVAGIVGPPNLPRRVAGRASRKMSNFWS